MRCFKHYSACDASRHYLLLPHIDPGFTAMTAPRLLLLICLALMITISTLAGAETIQLKRSVRLKQPDQPVRLGDIAVLDGEISKSLAETVIAPKPTSDRAFEIPLATVRVSLRNLKVNWALINISGSKVIVRPAIAAVSQPPLAMQAMTIEPLVEPLTKIASPKETPFIDATSLVLEPTLRGFVTIHILEQLNSDATDLRLAFSNNDKEQLSLAASSYRFELTSSGLTKRSDRMQINVVLWQNDTKLSKHSILVKPQLKTTVAVLQRGIARNETIRQRDVQPVTKWLSPTAIQENAHPDYALGRVATSDLRKGDLLHATDVRRKNVVKRGDMITVNCLVGGHVLRCQAKAQEDGAVGQMIELKKLGEKQSFIAVISGAGECVLDFSRTNNTQTNTSTTLATDGI